MIFYFWLYFRDQIKTCTDYLYLFKQIDQNPDPDLPKKIKDGEGGGGRKTYGSGGSETNVYTFGYRYQIRNL
jgi:hypothetical protein